MVVARSGSRLILKAADRCVNLIARYRADGPRGGAPAPWPGGAHMRTSSSWLAVIDAVIRIDARQRAVSNEPVERVVDCNDERVVAAAQSHGDLPRQFGFGVIGMRITQPGIGVRVNIVGDGRWRHRASVEIAL